MENGIATREGRVAIVDRMGATYPANAPYHPTEIYPEYLFKDLANASTGDNQVYGMVRELFHMLGLDRQHFGTEGWNPLGELIQPGDHVVVKPNFVFHEHMGDARYTDSVVTHGSVIRAILDYVIIATKGSGKITVADTPLVSADFERVLKRSGLQEVTAYYHDTKGIQVNIQDMRPSYFKKEQSVIKDEVKLPGDPMGYATIDLGKESELASIAPEHKKYRVQTYAKSEPAIHHDMSRNEYGIPRTVLDADVFINVPKLKTHNKAGVTICLKNLIGISGRKEWLPHFRAGAPSEGGDQYPLASLLKRIEGEAIEVLNRSHPWLWKLSYPIGINLRKARKWLYSRGRSRPWDPQINPFDIKGGAWYGNDTLWRTILDLNKILFYADKAGQMRPERQRRYLAVVDGVVAGEGDGPFEPLPRACSMIIGGFSPISVDMLCTRLMGFDYARIPAVERASKVTAYSFGSFGPEDISVESTNPRWSNLLEKGTTDSLEFEAPPGWKGHIELRKPKEVAMSQSSTENGSADV